MINEINRPFDFIDKNENVSIDMDLCDFRCKPITHQWHLQYLGGRGLTYYHRTCGN